MVFLRRLSQSQHLSQPFILTTPSDYLSLKKQTKTFWNLSSPNGFRTNLKHWVGNGRYCYNPKHTFLCKSSKIKPKKNYWVIISPVKILFLSLGVQKPFTTKIGARHHGIKDDLPRSSYILLVRPSTLIRLSYSIYSYYQTPTPT